MLNLQSAHHAGLSGHSPSLASGARRHKELIQHIQKILSGELPPLRADSEEDRRLLVKFATHCADLHTPTLEPDVSQRVAFALGREFDMQAEKERAAGLQVTVMLAKDAQSRAALELSFGQYVVRPLYVQLSGLFPELSIFAERMARVGSLPRVPDVSPQTLFRSRVLTVLLGPLATVACRTRTPRRPCGRRCRRERSHRRGEEDGSRCPCTAVGGGSVSSRVRGVVAERLSSLAAG